MSVFVTDRPWPTTTRRLVESIRAVRLPYVVGLFVLAVVVRLAIGGVMLSAGPEAFVASSDDGDAYDAAARWLAFGEPVVMTQRLAQKWAAEATVGMRWPQGYWLFLAGQYALLGSAYVTTVALQALIGGGGVLAAYALARTALSKRAARLAGGAVALSSTGIVLSAALYAESLYIPLLVGGLALVAATNRPGLSRRATWMWLASGGAAFALAEVTRPLALPVFLVAALWCLLPLPSRTVGERMVMLLLLCGGFVVTIAPFVAHDVATSGGQITTFTVGGAEAFGDQSRVALLAYPGDPLRAVVSGLPERLAVLFMAGWAPLGEPLVLLLGPASQWLRLAQWALAALGAMWLLASARRRRTGLLLGLAALAIVGPSLVLGLPLIRYRAAADPLFIVAMIAGLVALRDLRDRSRESASLPRRG